jgi:hypothetical protein
VRPLTRQFVADFERFLRASSHYSPHEAHVSPLLIEWSDFGVVLGEVPFKPWIPRSSS